MIRIAVFLTILAAALVYALRKGAGPERAMASILIAMLLADQLLHLFVPPRFSTVDMGHLLIDLAAAGATFVLAMTAHRSCRHRSVDTATRVSFANSACAAAFRTRQGP